MTFDARTVADILTAIVGVLAMAAILEDALAGTRIQGQPPRGRRRAGHNNRPPGGGS